MYQLQRWEVDSWVTLQTYYCMDKAIKEADFQNSIGYHTLIRYAIGVIYAEAEITAQ